MADYTHTIDRWDEATGENLIEQIAAVGDYLIRLTARRAGRLEAVAFHGRTRTRRFGIE